MAAWKWNNIRGNHCRRQGNSIGTRLISLALLNQTQAMMELFIREAVGPAAFITKARVQLLRDFGPALSPQSAFQFTLGLETLHVRMKEHIVQYEDCH